MELFLLLIYAFSILALYEGFQRDGPDDPDEDSGEYNLIDTL
jgi:hypothetical protein